MAVWCKHWLSGWQTHSSLSSSCACILSLISLHSIAFLWSVAAGHIRPKVLFMGQQCQAETFHGFIPCSLQGKTSLLARIAAHASKGNKIAVGYTSVSIALVTFIGILTYHILQQLGHTKLWKKIPKVNFNFKKLNNREAVDNLNNHINDPTGSVNLNQLREPWLEDLLQPTHSSFWAFVHISTNCY